MNKDSEPHPSLARAEITVDISGGYNEDQSCLIFDSSYVKNKTNLLNLCDRTFFLNEIIDVAYSALEDNAHFIFFFLSNRREMG